MLALLKNQHQATFNSPQSISNWQFILSHNTNITIRFAKLPALCSSAAVMISATFRKKPHNNNSAPFSSINHFSIDGTQIYHNLNSRWWGYNAHFVWCLSMFKSRQGQARQNHHHQHHQQAGSGGGVAQSGRANLLLDFITVLKVLVGGK